MRKADLGLAFRQIVQSLGETARGAHEVVAAFIAMTNAVANLQAKVNELRAAGQLDPNAAPSDNVIALLAEADRWWQRHPATGKRRHP